MVLSFLAQLSYRSQLPIASRTGDSLETCQIFCNLAGLIADTIYCRAER